MDLFTNRRFSRNIVGSRLKIHGRFFEINSVDNHNHRLDSIIRVSINGTEKTAVVNGLCNMDRNRHDGHSDFRRSDISRNSDNSTYDLRRFDFMRNYRTEIFIKIFAREEFF